MSLILPAESVSRIVCSICSIDNITDRTTLRNRADAKEQQLKQSRPTFITQEGLVDFRGRRQQRGNAVSERNFRQRPHQRPPSSLHCSRHRAAREANRPIPAPQTPVSLSSAGPLASSMRVPWERRRRNWARDLVGARRRGCRLGAARSAALHEKHANLGYASLTSCLKSPRRGQRPSICEELVLGNSTLKKPTWANAELYGGNHSHRAFQTHISTVFVHDIGFPRKRGRVDGLLNDDASTHFGGRTRGGRLAAGLRLAGRLAGDKLAASGERANNGRRQPGRRKTVE